MKKTNIFTDGSTTKIAYVIEGFRPKVIPLKVKATVNEGEYWALIYALLEAIGLGITRVSVWSDSQLMVRQINGQYRCKNKRLLELLTEVWRLAGILQEFEIDWIHREENDAGILLESKEHIKFIQGGSA